MAARLDFYQIYFKDDQRGEIYDFAKPYKNEEITPWFENAVIRDLVPKSEADYISICSWRLKAKREMGSCPFILKDTSLSEDKILSQDFDIAILRPFSKGHQSLRLSSNWHGKAWDIGLQELKKVVRVPHEITTPIYENHFIARKEIYQDYVNSQLKPTIDYMADKMDVFGADSGYIDKLRLEPERIKDYQNKSGRRDWPISVFLLERLFSLWIENKDFKIINL